MPYTLLDPLTVIGAGGGSGAGGIGGALGGILSGGSAGGVPTGTAALTQSNQQAQALLERIAQRQAAERAAQQPTSVQGVTVTAPTAAVNPSSALGQVVGSAAANIPGNGTPPPAQQQTQPEETEVSEVVVGPGAGRATAGADATELAGALGGGLVANRLAPGANLTPPMEVDPDSLWQSPDPDESPISPQEVALLGGGLAAGALLDGGGLTSSMNPQGVQSGNPVNDLLNLTPRDLIGAGLLGAGLIAGNGGGSGGAQQALEDLARSNAGLADRLGKVATSGFAGDIGGRGLNTINRMVTKAQAAIRQRYAQLGMTGSTAEQADLNAAAEAGVDLQFKIGNQMAQTGLTAIAALTGQSAAIYAQLLNAATAKDTALGNALANFAGALVR